MRKNLTVIGTLLVFAGVAAAQNSAPKIETYLGYDMLRYNSATNIPAFTANGAGGQFFYNFNSWLGVGADIYAAHNGNVFGSVTVNGVTYPGGKLDNTSVFSQFGPRVYVRKWSRVTPFVEMLWGMDTVRASVPLGLPPGQSLVVNVPGGTLVVNGGSASAKNVYVRASTAQTAFAYKLGGGLDIKMSKHLSFRPIETDLQYSRLQQLRYPQPNKSQYNFLYSTGFNFTFGGAQ
ncbi:MAG: hypothetical protein JO033_19650 [Acidobacteriaceae bacterium]|nr:hypothetical protein [Acidobacteriaceae bacterium]MBV9497793.1 hypothetical protein [Acidobacteriaceae bacterium]